MRVWLALGGLLLATATSPAEPANVRIRGAFEFPRLRPDHEVLAKVTEQLPAIAACGRYSGGIDVTLRIAEDGRVRSVRLQQAGVKRAAPSRELARCLETAFRTIRLALRTLLVYL